MTKAVSDADRKKINELEASEMNLKHEVSKLKVNCLFLAHLYERTIALTAAYAFHFGVALCFKSILSCVRL